jgi:hypothetical protein
MPHAALRIYAKFSASRGVTNQIGVPLRSRWRDPFFALLRGRLLRSTLAQLLRLTSTFMARSKSLEELCPIFSVGQDSVPEENLANLRKTSIFTLRDLYQSPL